jgi:hypothetical protein
LSTAAFDQAAGKPAQIAFSLRPLLHAPTAEANAAIDNNEEEKVEIPVLDSTDVSRLTSRSESDESDESEEMPIVSTTTRPVPLLHRHTEDGESMSSWRHLCLDSPLCVDAASENEGDVSGAAETTKVKTECASQPADVLEGPAADHSRTAADCEWQEVHDNGDVYYYSASTDSYRWSKPSCSLPSKPPCSLLGPQVSPPASHVWEHHEGNSEGNSEDYEEGRIEDYGYFYDEPSGCWCYTKRTRATDPSDVWTKQPIFDGGAYFYNETTGEASWDCPGARQPEQGALLLE